MAGRPKAGLDYAGWSVNIFDGDTKIDKLLDAQGWVGFSIYFYLCQMAYKFDGYFYRWTYDDSATTARRMGGGIGSETVRNTVGLCLQIGLFDKPLFDRDGILTSRGIQRRYTAAIQGRRVKTVIADYWLLDGEESKGLDKCASNCDFMDAESHLQAADDDLQDANDAKRKVKESKVKERKDIGVSGETPCRADARRVMDFWNSLGISQVTKIVPGTNRYDWLRKRIRDYGVDEILRAIENVRDSDFLMGRTNKPFTITFDWFIRPNNFAKILSGNYNRDGAAGKDTPTKSEDISWMKKYIAQRDRDV